MRRSGGCVWAHPALASATTVSRTVSVVSAADFIASSPVLCGLTRPHSRWRVPGLPLDALGDSGGRESSVQDTALGPRGLHDRGPLRRGCGSDHGRLRARPHAPLPGRVRPRPGLRQGGPARRQCVTPRSPATDPASSRTPQPRRCSVSYARAHSTPVDSRPSRCLYRSPASSESPPSVEGGMSPPPNPASVVSKGEGKVSSEPAPPTPASVRS